MALQKNLFEYLEHSAAQYGDKVAFADPKNAYTFRSLLHAAEAIGTFIMTRTNALNRPIAILVERSSLSLAGFMGILASGNYYVLMPMTQGLKITAQTDETEQAEADETDRSEEHTSELQSLV